MKFAAYGIFGSTLAMDLADILSAPQAVQYGALAILGWLVWYLLARSFPAHIRSQKEDRAAFLAAQKEEREGFLAAQAEARRDFRESLADLSSSLRSR
jgi:hypothetical protein